MKKKIKLNQLQVKSFVTTYEQSASEVRGAGTNGPICTASTDPPCATDPAFNCTQGCTIVGCNQSGFCTIDENCATGCAHCGTNVPLVCPC